MKLLISLLVLSMTQIVFADDLIISSKNFDECDVKSEELELNYSKAAYTICKIHLYEVTETANVNEEKLAGSLGDAIMQLDKLLAFGKKVWAIIEANRPVVEENFARTISVLPEVEGQQGDEVLNQMQGWSAPKARTYKVVYENYLGFEVISFTYTVYFQHGGSLDEEGQYLTSLNVVPASLNVSWGFTFNAGSELVTINNRGTKADPVAAATIQVNYDASSVMSDIRSNDTFHVTGAGELLLVR